MDMPKHVKGKEKSQKDYLTTTEFARLCGVSRFTIINWTNKGKIRAIKTIGGQYRIPVSEAISFFEAMHREAHHNEQNNGGTGTLVHCWEYPQKTNCDRQCKECLIYKKEIDCCFVIVRQFGKGVIRCQGDCQDCDYFEKVSHFYGNKMESEESQDSKTESLVTEKRGSQSTVTEKTGSKATVTKKSVLYNLVYGVGHGICEVKDKVGDVKEVVDDKLSRIKQMGKSSD